MSPEVSVFLIVFFAAFVQSLVGFGSALIAMPLLSTAIGLHVAAPMFVLCGLVSKVFMIHRYKRAFHFSAVWRLLVATIITIPVGIQLAYIVPQHTTMVLVGIILIVYGLYSLLGFEMVYLRDQRWAFGFGMVSGILSGAVNVGGPPYVVYGASQRWQPDEFKGNLQATYLFTTLTLLVTHWANGAINSYTLHFFAVAAPAVLLGLALGFSMERFISPALFRRAVLVLLLLIGLSLVLS